MAEASTLRFQNVATFERDQHTTKRAFPVGNNSSRPFQQDEYR